jgi:hypothetical protein
MQKLEIEFVGKEEVKINADNLKVGTIFELASGNKYVKLEDNKYLLVEVNAGNYNPLEVSSFNISVKRIIGRLVGIKVEK